MKLCMIGTGYVGLVTGTCFADLGNTVYCVDKNKSKINLLTKGKPTIFEPGLDEILKKNFKSGRLIFTTDIVNAVKKSDIIFICVGTPNKKNSQSVDLSYVINSVKEIAKCSNNKKIIVTKSTVPIGTGDLIEKIFTNKSLNRTPTMEIGVLRLKKSNHFK